MTADNGGAKVDLGVLEEDDEFEEFPTDGKICLLYTSPSPRD